MIICRSYHSSRHYQRHIWKSSVHTKSWSFQSCQQESLCSTSYGRWLKIKKKKSFLWRCRKFPKYFQDLPLIQRQCVETCFATTITTTKTNVVSEIFSLIIIFLSSEIFLARWVEQLGKFVKAGVTLKQLRSQHLCWKRKNGVLLLGGENSPKGRLSELFFN